MIILDIDHFKSYNHIGGHLLGDECLRAVADTINRTIRHPADMAALFGGEEFVALFPDTTLDGAVAVAHRILDGIRQLTFNHAHPRNAKKITASR